MRALGLKPLTAAGDTIDQLTMSQPTSSVDGTGDVQAKREVALGDAFPNPFNPVTTIAFSVPSESVVELDVLNLRGEVVRTLVRGERLSGEQNLTWNRTDNSGREVGSGVYFYQLRAAGRRLEVVGSHSQDR